MITVCGIKTILAPDEDEPKIDEVYPIAGSFAISTGRQLDPDFKRLEDLPDSDTKGLRIVLHGGIYIKQRQRAVIDMQCDPGRTGNEKSPFKKGKDDEDEKLARSEDEDKEPDEDEDDDENSLRFVSYQMEEEDKDVKTLRLDWRTKYACESFEEDDDGGGKDSSSKHWGFFTWFIVLYVTNLPGYLPAG